MSLLLGQVLLLLVFSLALALVVSGYRDDAPRAIWRGALRRTLHFAGAVLAIGLAAQLVGYVFLRPR